MNNEVVKQGYFSVTKKFNRLNPILRSKKVQSLFES